MSSKHVLSCFLTLFACFVCVILKSDTLGCLETADSPNMADVATLGKMCRSKNVSLTCL